MKTKRSYIFSWAVILAVGIAIGLMTRLSYAVFRIEDIDYNKISVGLGSQSIEELFNQKLFKYKSFNELYEKSDLVIKAIFEGVQEPQNESIFSTVKVLDVYKGDSSKTGADIFVYEPSFFGYGSLSRSFFTDGCYNLMKKNTEYILFLNHKEFSDKYKPSEVEKNTYLVNNNAFGKYDIANAEPISLLNPDKEYTYSEVASEEIITTSQEILNMYIEWKSDVVKNLADTDH